MRLSNKLDFTKLELFKIIRVLELVIYKLDLLDSMRITKTYYIIVLEPSDPEAPLIKDMPDNDPESQEKIWKVKKIINLDLINNNK